MLELIFGRIIDLNIRTLVLFIWFALIPWLFCSFKILYGFFFLEEILKNPYRGYSDKKLVVKKY